VQVEHLLSLVTLLPAAAAVLFGLIPGRFAAAHRWLALLVSLLVFGLSCFIWTGFDANTGIFQLTERLDWIPQYGISYHLGVDGISLLLVLLTTFLVPVVILASWRSVSVNPKGYYISMLLLTTGMIGAFLALDLFLFYVFWELMLIPMYFIIGVWGGPRRIYAAVKFFLFTMVGSVLMLVAILYLAWHHGVYTGGPPSFDYLDLVVSAPHIAMGPTFFSSAPMLLFAAFGLAFAIKVPMFPFHTWLPDAHVEAPTAGSVILAGVLLKMGGYGFLRLAIPLFPDASLTFAPWIGLLAVNAVALGAGHAVMPDAAAIGSIAPQIVYFAIGTVVLGVLGFNASVKHLGPLNVMLMLNVIPVAVFGIEAALGRAFVPIELGGAAMVIAALVANNLYLRRR